MLVLRARLPPEDVEDVVLLRPGFRGGGGGEELSDAKEEPPSARLGTTGGGGGEISPDA
jgi:hypothetical protein